MNIFVRTFLSHSLCKTLPLSFRSSRVRGRPVCIAANRIPPQGGAGVAGMVADGIGLGLQPALRDRLARNRPADELSNHRGRKTLTAGGPKIGLTAMKPGLSSSTDEIRGSAQQHWPIRHLARMGAAAAEHSLAHHTAKARRARGNRRSWPAARR